MSEKEKAFEAKALYNKGLITREEAQEMIQPYKSKFEETSKRLAKKYGMKPQKFSFVAFMR